jgi:hypothetical protein
MKNINLRDVNPDLHKAFKVACDLKGHTMRWVLIQMMQKYVDYNIPTAKVETAVVRKSDPNGADGERLPF